MCITESLCCATETITALLIKCVIVVHLQSHVQLFAAPWSLACQALLSSTIIWSLLKFMFAESVLPSNHLILCHALLLLPSIFPSINVYFKELALCLR